MVLTLQTHSSQFPEILDIDFFDGLSLGEKRELLDVCELRKIDSPTEFLQQYEAPDGIFIIVEGSVEVSFVSVDGSRILILLAGAGTTLGALEVMADRPTIASCVAFPGTTLLLCPTDVLRSKLPNPIFVRNLSRLAVDMVLRDNALRTYERSYNAEQRICRLLFHFTEQYADIHQDQHYLAELFGCSRQTLNKELRRLQSDGIVSIKTGHIRVLDRAALQKRIDSLEMSQ